MAKLAEAALVGCGERVAEAIVEAAAWRLGKSCVASEVRFVGRGALGWYLSVAGKEWVEAQEFLEGLVNGQAKGGCAQRRVGLN